jgi:TRAP-type C4-dicarboxylate transport system permease small subunit
VSLDWVPMSVVQSVIPISSAMIVVAEITHLIDLVIDREPPPPTPAGPALADGLH